MATVVGLDLSVPDGVGHLIAQRAREPRHVGGVGGSEAREVKRQHVAEGRARARPSVAGPPRWEAGRERPERSAAPTARAWPCRPPRGATRSPACRARGRAALSRSTKLVCRKRTRPAWRPLPARPGGARGSVCMYSRLLRASRPRSRNGRGSAARAKAGHRAAPGRVARVAIEMREVLKQVLGAAGIHEGMEPRHARARRRRRGPSGSPSRIRKRSGGSRRGSIAVLSSASSV